MFSFFKQIAVSRFTLSKLETVGLLHLKQATYKIVVELVLES